MTFQRMELEDWFDRYQFEREVDLGESAVKFLKVQDLNVDLGDVDLRYGHHSGSPKLRSIIAEDYPGLSGDNIIVTNGGSEAIFSLYNGIMSKGDRLVVEHPNYPSLYEIPQSIGCEIALLRLSYDNNFRPDLDELDSLVTHDTKILCITHPNNPTGSTISEHELLQIVDICEKKDVILLSDETYLELNFDSNLPPAASLSANAISLSTMSKCYGLPGIRIGWMATKKKEILDRILCVREYTTITNSAVGEHIAGHVLQNKADFLGRAKSRVDENKKIVCDWIERHEYVEWVKPTAGVVGLGRLKEDAVNDPQDLYDILAQKYKTMTIPGKYFGLDNRFFRLGFGANSKEIAEGLQRFDKAIADIRMADSALAEVS